MWSYSQLSILVFGITAFVSGWITLISPASAGAQLQLSSECWTSMNGNGLAAIGMGIYYTLAAFQNNRTFFKLTVPMRLLTTFVFWNQGWGAPALWEGGGAILTALAIWSEA